MRGEVCGGQESQGKQVGNEEKGFSYRGASINFFFNFLKKEVHNSRILLEQKMTKCKQEWVKQVKGLCFYTIGSEKSSKSFLNSTLNCHSVAFWPPLFLMRSWL